MGLFDGLLEKALLEALKHVDYGDGQLRDWLGYLEREAPEFVNADGAIFVPPQYRMAYARAAMKAAVETLLHGSPPE